MYKILIVDDEQNERNGIEGLLRAEGYPLQIRQAANGIEALEEFRREPADILLTDIKMPYMNGLELIEAVHKNTWDPVCVVYSAYDEFEYAQSAIRLGVLQYLLKPIRIKEFRSLFDTIFEVCEKKKRQNAQNAQLQQTLEDINNVRIARDFLRYLETPDAEPTALLLELCGSCSYLPVIISGYSGLLSRYWEAYKNDILQAIGEHTLVIPLTDTQFLLLARQQKTSESEITNLCLELTRISRENYQSDVFIVAWSRCGTLAELPFMYTQLSSHLDYQFFASKSMYLICDGLRIINNTSDVLPLCFERMLTCARLSDYEGIRNEFVRAFDYVETHTGYSSLYVKYIFSEEVKKCCEALRCENLLLQIVDKIFGSQSLAQVRDAVLSLIDSLSLAEKQESSEPRLVQQTKAFIHHHYSDCTLNVTAIAEELGVSASYLSTLFKVTTSMTLVRYISVYRIEKAQELLRTTNLKVAEIAEKVGCLNPSYFIAQFRNNTGLSPAKYRERIFQDDTPS